MTKRINYYFMIHIFFILLMCNITIAYDRNYTDQDHDGILEVGELLNFTGDSGDGNVPYDNWNWNFTCKNYNNGFLYFGYGIFQQYIYTYEQIGNYTVFLREGSIEYDLTEDVFINIEILLSNNVPSFIGSIPNFNIYNDEKIDYDTYFDDDNIKNITINSSCDFLDVTINNTLNKFFIYHDPDYSNMNLSYCNISFIYDSNYVYSNNFYVDVNDRPYSYAFLDLRQKDHIIILGLLSFIYVLFLCFGILFKNLILKSFAVFLGITIGMILIQVHWLLFILFIVKNVLLWIYG